MKLLAIDTSSTACSVALLINDEIQSIHQDAPMQQANIILPLIQQILRESNTSLNQLDALAFGCGPGSFTGVRIATSIAQGIGYASDTPLIPISSLAALAQSTHDELGWKNLLVAVDARVQEIYWGAYQVNPQGLVELIGEEQVCPPEKAVLPPGSNWQGAGNGWQVYPSQIPVQPSQLAPERQPMAVGILPLAKLKYQNHDWVSAENAIPTYLRDQVAKKSDNFR